MSETQRHRFTPLVVVALALALYALVNPLRLAHLAIVALFVVLVSASRTTRDLAVALLPAAIFGFVYDLLRLFAERSYHAVIIEPVYRLEQAIFGWMAPGADSLGPVDFFREHHHIGVDLMAGAFYSTHVPSVILFGLYLWWRSRRQDDPHKTRQTESRLHRFMWGYLLFNVLGFLVWITFPVAPPWYVEQFGLSAPGHLVQGDPAGLGRVDAWLGYPHFTGIYEQGTYVFGAMPSLHVAPSIWIALWARKTPIRWAAWIYAAIMSFFAVYLGHHYVVDVLAGALVAGGVYLLLTRTTLGEVPDRIAAFLNHVLDQIFEARAQEVAGE